MKKLFTLLTLLLSLGAATSAWGADETLFSMSIKTSVAAEVSTDATKQDKEYELTSYADFGVAGTSAVFGKSQKQAESVAKYIAKSSTYWFQIGSGGDKVYYKITLAKALQVGDVIAYQTKDTKADKKFGLLFNTQASTTGIGPTATTGTNSGNILNQNYTIKTGDNLIGKTTIYITRADGTGTNFNNLTITRPILGPTINTQPVGADYVTGAAATALSVSATASSGDLSYQWYSNTTESTTGAITIDGATSASYTPSTVAAGTTYYYCAVTDANGTVNTDIVSVVVAAAAAPTISITGTPGSAVAKDSEVTLTADITGNPSPTIQWYSNTTASNEGGAIIEGATNEKYLPSTAATGTYYYYAIATNSQGSATSAVQTITVQEKLKAPTINIANQAFITSISVSITDNSEESATIKYSTDGENWSDYSSAIVISAEGTTTLSVKVVKDGYIESDVVTGSFKKVSDLTEPTTVSTATTWDWSVPTNTVTLSTTSVPNTSATDICAADFNGTVYDDAGWGTFNAAALVMSNFQYPAHASNDCFQGTYLKFTTTVSGTIIVTFSNTGTSTRPDRYLYVNNVATEFKSSNTTKVTTDPIYVAAGDVELKGVIEGTGDNYLRIYKIVFTPAEAVSTLSGRSYGSFVTSQKLDFASAEGITAYIATGLNGTNDAVVLSEVDVVPAGTAVIVKTETQGATVNVPVTTAEASDVTANLLVAGDGTTVANSDYYYLASDQFHLATSGTLQSGKAYLQIPATARNLSIIIGGDATGISAIAKSQEPNANGYYNLAGQRVAQPTKGLYIQDGKKVIIK